MSGLDLRFKAACRRAAQCTDRNEHSEAVRILASAVNYRAAVAAMKAIDALHMAYGHMPDNLASMRREWLKLTLDRIRETHGEAGHALAYGAL